MYLAVLFLLISTPLFSACGENEGRILSIEGEWTQNKAALKTNDCAAPDAVATQSRPARIVIAMPIQWAVIECGKQSCEKPKLSPLRKPNARPPAAGRWDRFLGSLS